jgi:hypothetical protein
MTRCAGVGESVERVVDEARLINNSTSLTGFIDAASEGMTKLQAQIKNPLANLPVLIPKRISPSGWIYGYTGLIGNGTQKAFLLMQAP